MPTKRTPFELVKAALENAVSSMMQAEIHAAKGKLFGLSGDLNKLRSSMVQTLDELASHITIIKQD